MSLQIKRGNGAPSLLKAGEQYLDIDTGYLYIGDGAENKIYVDKTEVETLIAGASAPSEPSIKVASGTIPAIDADTREVVQVNLGVLDNPKSALVGFFVSTAVDAEIQLRRLDISSFKDALVINGISPQSARIPILYDSIPFIGSHSTGTSKNFLKVFEDYTKASRYITPSISGYEKYDADNNQDSYGFTYSELGHGVLIGWYTVSNTGAFLLDKKVVCESAWLTQSGDNTILNIALKNVDVAANTLKDFKVAVYE